MKAAFAAALLLLGAGAARAAWLKQYSMEPYSRLWHVKLKVKDMDKTVPEVIKTLEKNGGESTIDLKNAVVSKLHGYYQLSFRFSNRSAERAVRRLAKLGAVDASPPTLTPAADPEGVKEISAKLKQLKAETEAGRDSLQKMPAVSALASELAVHLDAASKAREAAKDRTLLNLEIFEEAR